MSTSEKIINFIAWFWFISRFGLVPAFIYVGLMFSSSAEATTAFFGFAFLIVTLLLWVLFFYVENRVRGQNGSDCKGLYHLSALADAILGIYTILGLFFYIEVASKRPLVPSRLRAAAPTDV